MSHERINRFDKLLQVRAPQCLSSAIEAAADRRLQSKSEYIRHSVIDRLRADGIDVAGMAKETTRLIVEDLDGLSL